jgi:UDP-glucose 4-epimerase
MTTLRVAIVGANGFIAGHLIRQLQAMQGIQLNLFGRTAAGNFEKSVNYKQIDFSNAATLSADFAGMDLVYHMVSETIPSSSWEDPLIEIEKNLLPFTKFMNAIAPLGIKKIAFVSSAGTVYGPTSGKVSEDADKKPFSPYGIMKLTMENLLNYYKAKYDLNYDVYRVSNVYGEGQNTSKGLGIINTFLEKIIRDKSVTVFGDGNITRNYIYAGDVAGLLALSVNDLDSSGVYNVSSDCTMTINQLVEKLHKCLPEEFAVDHVKNRQSDNSFVDLDNSRILSRAAGFAFTDIEEGIKRTYKELKKQKVNNQQNG